MFRRLSPDIRGLIMYVPSELRETLISNYTDAFAGDDIADGGEAKAKAKAAGAYTRPLFGST